MVFGVTFYTVWSWQDSSRNPIDGENQPGAAGELASLVAGTFYGDVISDAKGSSRSDISVTVDRIDSNNVRVSSAYQANWHRRGRTRPYRE